MMVGHALLAFSLVAIAARNRGVGADRSLAAGVAAGLLATVPDVDMVYALAGLAAIDPAVLALDVGTGGVFAITGAFWGASTVVHRTATHSVVLAVPVALAVGAWTADRSGARAVGGAVVAAVAAVSWITSGALDGTIVALFGGAALAVAEGIRLYGGFRPTTTAAIAFVGLASHPFGDLFTGEPPRLLYPLGVELLDARVALSADPTLHLLGAFGLELLVVWIAAATYLGLVDDSPLRFVDRRAALAVGYGATALVLTPPTLQTSYHFVFSILAVGVALAVPELGLPSTHRIRAAFRSRTVDADRPLSVLLTAVAAVSLGWFAYLGAYLANLVIAMPVIG